MDIQLNQWMSNLPAQFVILPLFQLVIPGSHESFTYYLDMNGPIAENEPEWLQDISWLPDLKQVVYRWSRTQQFNVTQQLEHGIRYFDFRLARVKDNPDKIKIVHGLYGMDVQSILNDILQFLNSHPKEIVLLDFQALYSFNNQTHATLVAIIKQAFGSKLCPVIAEARTVTLQNLWNAGRQVIIFYNNESISSQNNVLWLRKKYLSSPWANADSYSALINYLDQKLIERSVSEQNATFFVTQAVLTPKSKDILEHVFGSLETQMASPTTKKIIIWLRNINDTLRPKLNIVMCDFINIVNFTRSVILKNYHNL